MTKRIVSLLLAAVIAAMLVPSFAGAEWIMYVYTDDGKTLNVRSDPSVGNNLLGRLDYGSAVSVRMTSANGWACIDFNAPTNGNVAYVQTRFLVSAKPAPKSVTPSQDPVITDAAKVLNDMNAEFRTARVVTVPFTVAARPARASGWVNLRWAPTTEAERISTCTQGKELVVLAELNNWYQVQDPVTGMIGFISRQYVVRK
ncbi:MAG: SH3 domain-containing protein [Clostridia bacterium]|nr:SH3 domain-containing protein [Clostridia bacterium]